MTNAVAFIDTTTIVDSVMKPGIKVNIQNHLKRFETILCSNYIRMELKRGPLQYIVALHNLCVTLKKLSAVQEKIAKLSATPQRHRLGMYLGVLSNFWLVYGRQKPAELQKEGEQGDVDEIYAKRISSYLRIQMKLLWLEIDKISNEMINPMKCFIDIMPPKQLDNGQYDNYPSKCNNSAVQCSIREFFRLNESEFEQIYKKLASIPEEKRDEETSRRITALKKILRLLPYNRGFSNKEPNYKSCWSCGDAIIAICAPEDATILTSNEKHYAPICDAIKRIFVNYNLAP